MATYNFDFGSFYEKVNISVKVMGIALSNLPTLTTSIERF